MVDDHGRPRRAGWQGRRRRGLGAGRGPRLGQRHLLLPAPGGAQRRQPGALRRGAQLRRAADRADRHDLDRPQLARQRREIHLMRRHVQVVEAEHQRREAQEARGTAELVGDRGHDHLRPRIEQPQHQQVEIRPTQPERFEAGVDGRC
ncbi:hypothetical protein QE401_001222 [Pseudoroseomonas cervicalis]|nr:hypothetical protein [Pseudoroseomonas cervicalis]